jgi:hypothetical protein
MRIRQWVQVLISSSLVLNGCTWESKRPSSFLILAVDSLSSDQVSCTDLETGEPLGFQVLCSESVRFTHAYTPSVLSQPAITSLLTARWPHQHEVFHNGPDFLKAQVNTVGETALRKNFRTFFLSGGPPIWKKSGLDQGFEVFEDNIQVGRNRFYRSIHESTEIFLSWLKRDVDGDPFLSVLYVPDLQVFDFHDSGPESGPTEISFEGRLDFLNRELANLFQEMKEMNRWNDTYVFLVGLNGRPHLDRSGELDGYNLLSENSQVALLIKPSQSKKRDLGIQWKIDNNVSLIDVAVTLFDLLGEKVASQEPFAAISLAKTLASPEATWNPDRPILIQSAWSEWHGVGRNRVGIRKGSYLFLHEFPPKIFNSLIDRMETSPIKPTNSRWPEMVSMFAPYTGELKSTAWVKPPDGLLRKVIYARALWTRSHPVAAETYLEQVLSYAKSDVQTAGWFAQASIEKAKWNDLLKLGKKSNNSAWIYLASQHLKLKSNLPESGCFKIWEKRVAKEFDLQDLKSCDDRTFRDLLTWIQLNSSSEANYHRETFVRNYSQLLTDRRVGQLNYVNGLYWDVPLSLPAEPTEGEILLNLPENQKYLALAQEKLKGEGP